MGWLIFLIVVVVLVGVGFTLRKTFSREIDRYKRIRRSQKGE
ncbi:septation ring formation regulator EzrA [Psychromicrobium silvestre]|uniref:Septation ring formation regulator EzrA n=1 Tax=Psychromicrobium silvestre TaxID=1645614 RepID=A0A7Y9LTF2_9MICC|nr:hypothetical protein [Psychromicrobium silvestre]NYE95275.1 septation ring formation regulator EzrA [Psychromicrobium silvestre]